MHSSSSVTAKLERSIIPLYTRHNVAMEMGWRVGLRVLFLRVGERVVKRFGLRVGFDLLLPFGSGSQTHGTLSLLLYTHRNNVSRASFRVCKVRPPVACVHPSSPPHVEPAKKDLIDET